MHIWAAAALSGRRATSQLLRGGGLEFNRCAKLVGIEFHYPIELTFVQLLLDHAQMHLLFPVRLFDTREVSVRVLERAKVPVPPAAIQRAAPRVYDLDDVLVELTAQPPVSGNLWPVLDVGCRQIDGVAEVAKSLF